jgi:hypothetical protein
MKALSFVIVVVFGCLVYVAIKALIAAFQWFDMVSGYYP